MSDELKPVYANLGEFVEEYLSKIYSRQVQDASDTAWCTKWYRHFEAAMRLDALWFAWETLQKDERGGISFWLAHHADPHMAKLFDPRGPFKYCSVRNGHVERIGPLPIEPPPPDMFTGLSGRPDDGWVFSNVVEFVENYLTMMYQRQVADQTDATWCPQWWQHPEAVVRLDALWRAWEYYRRTSTGISEWILQHADRHMAKLFDPRGPFRYCNVRSGHKDEVNSLPVTVEESGTKLRLFDPEPGNW